MAILALIAVSFHTIVSAISKTETNLLLRRKAILAIDNAVEIFEASPPPIAAGAVDKILDGEWKRQGLEGNGKLRFERRSDTSPKVVVLDSKDHVLLSVPLPAGGK